MYFYAFNSKKADDQKDHAAVAQGFDERKKG